MSVKKSFLRPVVCVILPVALATSTSMAGDPCAADLNGSGGVDGFDLALLLGAWGPYAPCPPVQPADLDGSCTVNGLDLANLLAAWGTSCPVGKVLETELAGNSLTSYPHFQYVIAINAGSTVQVAIDPTRFPDLVDEAVDIYVVAAKTAAQWISDSSLTDVTGGAQTATITGGTIQVNTFTISGGSGLSADAGTGVGVPYDVVLDVNQNGVLDGGDYVDGGGDEAGFYMVHDTTLPGPYTVVELNFDIPNWTTAPPVGWGGPAGYQNENIFYPSNIASLGQLPLLVVSRGNGHNHNWYDHIGNHMGSYGYVVMSHNNQTEPGTSTAATTTLLHTDAFIENLPVIAAGAMNGHVDVSRISWIGHSRGGEGVVRAYDRLVDSVYIPQNYSVSGVKLVMSICPTYFSPGTEVDPNTVNYHLFYTGADDDVEGNPSATGSKPLAILEKAAGNKHLTYFHGAGHGDFHNGAAPAFAAGPDLIGKVATHKGLLSHLLPVLKHYIDGNVPAREYLTRMYDDFHAAGVPANVIITREFRDAASANSVIIDDYQTQTSTGTSSSGGAVTFSVSNVAEGLMSDVDGSFAFSAGVPMNGMTRGIFPAVDLARCVVFDWNTAGSVFYELAVPPALADFTGKEYLSFRAAQGTRHPETDALNAPLNFTVELRDGDGDTSAINFSNYGDIVRTYLRTGFGAGAGWCNEFGTVRLRLSDFLNNGSDLDLDNIQAIRFLFGQTAGSPRGRIGLDDVELTTE